MNLLKNENAKTSTDLTDPPNRIYTDSSAKIRV